MLKKIVAIFICSILLCSIAVSAEEVPQTNSYTYSTMMGFPEPLAGPMPYKAVSSLKFIGENAPSNPIDMVFDRQGENLYIVDNQQSYIYIYDKDLKVKDIIKGFTRDGQEEMFMGPEGVYIDENGDIYICDTGAMRIIVLDKNKKFIKEILKPDSPVLGEDYQFAPNKITVDKFGNMFVVSKGDTNGLMQLDRKGKFINYIGSNKVVFNPFLMFWKKIMSEKQREQLTKFIPITFSNLSQDKEGFIYLVSDSLDETQPIKRINLNGTNVLKQNGYVQVTGDYDMTSMAIPSSFCDIISDDKETFYALDKQLGKIFVYNYDGYLLYVFGGLGNTVGTFTSPTSIEINNDTLYVLDNSGRNITMFERTDYARMISEADEAYRHGRYEESKKIWENVLDLNSNYELAYAQIGTVLLEQGKEKEAMKYFKLGNYRGNEISLLDGYNKAYTDYRKVFSQQYLTYIIIAVAVVWIGAVVIKKIVRKKRRG